MGMEKMVGIGEVEALVQMFTTKVKDVEVEVYGEHHAPHETVMDWKIKAWYKMLPNYPISLTLRTHFMLEPPSTKGGPEKVFKITEEWGGNPLMNERTVTPSLLGKVHSKLRRFTGYLIVWACK